MPYQVPGDFSDVRVGSGEYVIQQGECLESIAFVKGLFWETIWNDPQNADVKKARGSANLLLPGDRIHIPDLREKQQNCATDKVHKFVRKGVPSKLRVRALLGGRPRANERYRLVVDNVPFDGKTDADGWIEIQIPPNAQSGTLTVGVDPLHKQVFDLALGGMDPITTSIGIQKRLFNLGYDCEPTEEMDEATRSVIAMFQKEEDLEATGEPDKQTLERLLMRSGC